MFSFKLNRSFKVTSQQCRRKLIFSSAWLDPKPVFESTSKKLKLTKLKNGPSVLTLAFWSWNRSFDLWHQPDESQSILSNLEAWFHQQQIRSLPLDRDTNAKPHESISSRAKFIIMKRIRTRAFKLSNICQLQPCAQKVLVHVLSTLGFYEKPFPVTAKDSLPLHWAWTRIKRHPPEMPHMPLSC